jgi:hypothetical protein
VGFDTKDAPQAVEIVADLVTHGIHLDLRLGLGVEGARRERLPRGRE